MYFDAIIYISQHFDLITLIKLSMTCSDLYLYLKSNVKKLCDNIPWRISIEYLCKNNKVEIHHIDINIGFFICNKWIGFYENCTICCNKKWKKRRNNYICTISKDIISSKNIKVNVFHGKSTKIFDKIHYMGYFPVYCTISNGDVILSDESKYDYYDEISPHILSFDYIDNGFLDYLDNDKRFDHVSWPNKDQIYDYYIHYNGYNNQYYKNLS